MGQTNKKKLEIRESRLKGLPQSERLLKSALIKKKEGRVLDASEKHALKMQSENGEILRLWEALRATTTTTSKSEEEGSSVAVKKSTAYEEKYPIVRQLIKLIEPKFETMVRTPTISRVLQSMVKYGSQDHMHTLAKWVTRDALECATGAYGHFVFMAVLRHANREAFHTIMAALLPVVPQLVHHKFGVQVLHSAYTSRWCTAEDRNLLLLSIFRDNAAVMRRWEGYPILEKVLAQNKSIQRRLLTRLFDLVDKLISQKEAIGFPFVQRLAYAFLLTGTRDEVSELCDTLRPHVASTISTTREGAPLASLAFSLTHPKKKKEILRDVHANLGELTTNKYSAPFIARLFDFLYDGQLLMKYLANDMVEHIEQVVNNEYGYRIFLHLLTPHKQRKERFLFSHWLTDHNLFSEQNADWNHHTWLTGEYEPEQVEVCSKPAMASHIQAAVPLVRAFLAYATAEKNASRVNRYHASLIAREILLVTESHPAYKVALALTPTEVMALKKLAPAAGGSKRERDENDTKHKERQEEEEEGSREPPKKAAKKEKKVKKITKESKLLEKKASSAAASAGKKSSKKSR